jgi:hypothetical protein
MLLAHLHEFGLDRMKHRFEERAKRSMDREISSFNELTGDEPARHGSASQCRKISRSSFMDPVERRRVYLGA